MGAIVGDVNLKLELQILYNIHFISTYPQELCLQVLKVVPHVNIPMSSYANNKKKETNKNI